MEQLFRISIGLFFVQLVACSVSMREVYKDNIRIEKVRVYYTPWISQLERDVILPTDLLQRYSDFGGRYFDSGMAIIQHEYLLDFIQHRIDDKLHRGAVSATLIQTYVVCLLDRFDGTVDTLSYSRDLDSGEQLLIYNDRVFSIDVPLLAVMTDTLPIRQQLAIYSRINVESMMKLDSLFFHRRQRSSDDNEHE